MNMDMTSSFCPGRVAITVENGISIPFPACNFFPRIQANKRINHRDTEDTEKTKTEKTERE
jgi:hypothetical protein